MGANGRDISWTNVSRIFHSFEFPICKAFNWKILEIPGGKSNRMEITAINFQKFGYSPCLIFNLFLQILENFCSVNSKPEFSV